MTPLQNCKFVQMIKPEILKSGAYWTGADPVNNAATALEVDTMGYRYLTVVVSIGVCAADIAEMDLYECETATGTYTAITGGAYGTTANPLPTTTTDETAYAFHVDLAGRKRYIALRLKAGAGNSYAAAIGILSDASVTPNTATERGLGTDLFV